MWSLECGSRLSNLPLCLLEHQTDFRESVKHFLHVPQPTITTAGVMRHNMNTVLI